MALLLAMIILALVTTVMGTMVWQQTRAVQVEGAERARSQAAWLLLGAQDWAALTLIFDQQRGGGATSYDGLDEAWAAPLAETRLSAFLAVDKNNNAATGPDAFISGSLEDAQGRYNLRNLLDENRKPKPLQLQALQRLCGMAGLQGDCAQRVAQAMAVQSGALEAAASGDVATDLALPALGLKDLSWMGLEPKMLEALERWVDILPEPTPLNVNTASSEVLSAMIEGLDLGGAKRLATQRLRAPFTDLEKLTAMLPPSSKVDNTQLAVSSRFFYVTTRLRWDDRVFQELSLLERRDGNVAVVRRERRSLSPAGP